MGRGGEEVGGCQKGKGEKMNGGIDKDGCLWIERAGLMIRQWCPFSNRGDSFSFSGCVHNCPLFGEPETDLWTDENGDTHRAITVSLCKKYLRFFSFTDYRERK